MSSSSEEQLRSVLMKTDGSAMGIQNSAAIMMRHYDKSPQVAVTEWRNCLHTCEKSQLLPLLYVANEVLQNSKRNRGNKFLEAYSPILGQALQYMVQRDLGIVEKVRRVTKIWGDRRVFSVRFVSDLLQGLEQYRHGNNKETPEPEAKFSPPPTLSPPPRAVPKQQEKVTPEPLVLEDENKDNDDDEEDMFAFESPSQHLDLDINVIAASASTKKKRRRSSGGKRSSPVPAISPSSKRRRKSVLSTSSLVELWNTVSQLQQSYQQSMAALSTIKPQHVSTDGIEDLVGDELLDSYKKVTSFQDLVSKQQCELHSIATDRKALESDAVAYIPWLRSATQQDEEDSKLATELREKIVTLQACHGAAKAARDARVQAQEESKKRQQEALKKKQQEEERRKLLESAIKVETEAKPGMVWNKATQEYQYLNTDESWRD